ncbi:MAG: Glycosyltransferase [Candidatus Gottesmanbacteria bacterium GW2011_GWB1_43_11]|uniref:Glycosyltransferase n=1 Tax=Candidatus Gottesmanbacteria bacterium GW2011_GWB1_43_11 TaxID=1618446 RepID=A0A0G1CPE8_9BACT|nr:MAG: Glycosyltransferase [Candidatus Gottesmanbacteria bacterium GW2011_GWA2_42_16]KKS56232.1 MAG: Glycosyltransferase [Candidatus Gottesmanbacteria bacterium GW2011_GWA1_42_26]KKS82565.1 MAG: Glycosyltransferase [Candidatus Gottesmanbacteria bacterium GW2011_GWC1_43_10]KKS87434.1 MAG: Glycosyltransferase [Candidatus Gottesmanbacteria bacterium GW2011_GWB1_43_11]HCM37603.1 hypothetical protein [Patescibacteria group bacterium]
MRVAIIEPPLMGHMLRGTGVYTRNLARALEDVTDMEIVMSEIESLPKNVDLYHFPYFDPFFRTLPVIRNKPTVVTVHDLTPIRFPEHFPRGIKGELKWQLQKYILRGIEAVITDSQASKVDVEKFVGLDPQKVHSVYLAPEPEFFEKRDKSEKENIRKKYQLPGKFAIYTGEVNWNKNLPNIIKAATLAKIHLLIISKSFIEKHEESYNPWKDSLLESQTLARNNPWVKGLGYVKLSELVTIYQMASVLLLPSYYEGFGLPVVEAFASGCPVITSDKGSLGEVAAGASLIVEPDDVSGMAKAIHSILTDQELGRKLIKKGKNKLSQFTWKKTADQTFNVYNSVLDK